MVRTSVLNAPARTAIYSAEAPNAWANLDTLGMGALIACIQREPERLQHRARYCLKWAVPLCAVEIVVARFVPAAAVWVWLDPLAVALISVWAVWTASTGFEGLAGRLLSHPVTVYLGRISYGLYVWHMFAPAFLRNILHALHLPDSFNAGVIGFILDFGWTVATASLTWFLFEKPINSLKRYFPYRKSPKAIFHPSANVSPLS